MRLNELFNTTYKLVPVEGLLKKTIERQLRAGGLDNITVTQAQEDPRQVFMLGKNNGAWEVHHVLIANQQFVSGRILNTAGHANPKFISTAIELYNSKLDSGDNIRIIGTKTMWPTYQKVIARMLKKHPDFIADSPHEYDTYGIPTVSQLLRRQGEKDVDNTAL